MIELKKIKGFKVFPNGYRVSTRLTQIFSLLVVTYMVFAMITILSNDRYYVVNDNSGDAPNPFYLSQGKHIPQYLKEMETLPPGFEAGHNHSGFIANAQIFALIILGLGAGVNHLLYNNKKQRAFYEGV